MSFDLYSYFRIAFEPIGVVFQNRACALRQISAVKIEVDVLQRSAARCLTPLQRVQTGAWGHVGLCHDWIASPRRRGTSASSIRIFDGPFWRRGIGWVGASGKNHKPP